MMMCNLMMKPILLATGILAIAASAAIFALAREPERVLARAAAR